MAAYELLADLWDEPDAESETGYVRHLRGEVFDVPDKHLDRLLRIGALAPVDDETDEPDDIETVDEGSPDEPSDPADDSDNDAGSETTSAAADKDADSDSAPVADGEAPAPGDVAPAPDLERPKQTAVKDVWVDYAVARGMDRVDAEALDKRELIAELS
ncbi:hypothetical protein GQ649_24170 [Rhodococcus sp. DSM 6344]|nr:hypothetical protein [Rhodococcus erythropolis]